MILSDMQTEFQARGFDFLSVARQTAYLNRAYFETCEGDDWPFLEATSTGVMPLTIADLRTVESVVDSTQLVKLRPMDRREITDVDPTYVTAGVASWYYITAGNTLNIYPANITDNFTVRYWKVPTELSAAGDTPIIPTRFQYATIIDGAIVYAYEDSDNFEAAAAARNTWEGGKEWMRNSLLVQQHDEPSEYIVTHNMDAP